LHLSCWPGRRQPRGGRRPGAWKAGVGPAILGRRRRGRPAGETRDMGGKTGGDLERHFGLLQAVALNVTMIVGARVFVTIPLMLGLLPGPSALLGWLGAGALILVDGLIWSELGAALPGSGGSYLYLLECYGRDRWGRLMAFLFIWQFLISGPLEVSS